MSIDDELSKLVATFKGKGKRFNADYQLGNKYHEGEIGLVELKVPKKEQGKGHGSSFMKDFLKIIDNYK